MDTGFWNVYNNPTRVIKEVFIKIPPIFKLVNLILKGKKQQETKNNETRIRIGQ